LPALCGLRARHQEGSIARKARRYKRDIEYIWLSEFTARLLRIEGYKGKSSGLESHQRRKTARTPLRALYSAERCLGRWGINTTGRTQRAAMYELDFQAVGEGERSGDAIAVRYTIPGRTEPIVGIIDAGFRPNGEALVEHVPRYYGTKRVDFVLLTHPDEDHANGMGEVVRGLDVRCLLVHRPALHGYASNSGAEPAEELVALVNEKGGDVVEPFAGVNGWDGSFLIAGPREPFYEEMLELQEEVGKEAGARGVTLAERMTRTRIGKTVTRKLAHFPVEIPFGDAGGDNARNNSSAILSLIVDDHHLMFMGDAGVPAINDGLCFLDARGRAARKWPRLVVLPHHGSRHNLDLATIGRMLGGHVGDQSYGYAVASVSAESDNPSPRVANAVGRRGYEVKLTAGMSFRVPYDAPPRPGWDAPVPTLPPLDETDLSED
jgi:beta-lactamase superfamily II metal-dependent hydrolase